MKCPRCNQQSKVLETRSGPSGAIRRRRECASCGDRFTTTEGYEREFLVRKAGGRIEPFDSVKISRSIGRAAHVLKLRGHEINAVADRIEKALVPEAARGPVPSGRIGDLVLEELRGLNPAADLARIRFAMVFLGRSDRPGALSNAREFLSWLESNFGIDENVVASHPGDAPVLVLKRDGRRTEAFSADKIMASIEVALKGRANDKTLRQISYSTAVEVAEQFADEPVVSSIQIGAEVLKHLKELDGLAYLRYSATFKGLNSPNLIAIDAASVLAVELDDLTHPSRKLTRGPMDNS